MFTEVCLEIWSFEIRSLFLFFIDMIEHFFNAIYGEIYTDCFIALSQSLLGSLSKTTKGFFSAKGFLEKTLKKFFERLPNRDCERAVKQSV